jgi:transposase-like protein
VEIPAYEAINRGGDLGSRILEILMCNVSTRHYQRVIPQMADTVGVSKSAVSRRFIEESGRQLEQLAERRFDDVEFLIIYIDGLVFGEHHIIGAVGVDSDGHKQVLGIREGASENAATATSLLEDLVERGLDPRRRYLFVIDGSKALRCAIDKIFGKGSPVQRCRRHKIRNVCDRLPADLSDQVKAVMKAAYRLPWPEGVAKLKKQAQWLEGPHPDAASSLREGLEETFTINRLELSPSLRLCLGTTNIIESPHAGVRMRTGRVSRWQNGQMVLRWVASAFLETEKNFRRIQGYRDLWMLKAKLRDDVTLDAEGKVA